MAVTAKEELENAEAQLEQDEQEYNSVFDALAEGKELPAEDEDDAEASAEESKDSPEEEVPTDGGDQPPEEGKGREETPEEEDEFAWVSELPDDLRKKAEALIHDNKSQKGRVRSFQSQLERERAARRQAAAQPAPANTPAEQQPEPSEEQEKLQKQIKEYEERYPDLIKMLKTFKKAEQSAVMAEYDQKLSDIKNQLAAKQQEEAYSAFERRTSELLEGTDFNHFSEITGSEAYRDWVGRQPAAIQAIAAHSVDPDECFDVLRLFVEHTELEYLRNSSVNPEEEKAKPDSKDKRKKLEKKVSPASRSVGVKGQLSGTYDDYFNEFAEN